jgi:hypothetical protein
MSGAVRLASIVRAGVRLTLSGAVPAFFGREDRFMSPPRTAGDMNAG